jgi:DNA polymerase
VSRREQFIAEMGLGPVWRLRHAPPAQAEPALEAPIETVTPPPAALPDGDERAARIARMNWTELKSAIAACEACGLCRTRRNAVVGVGDESADWMIVGEAPGAEEDERGEPFVGQAGRLLDSMLAAVDLKRGSNVYIANVLKCRPPGNRNPEPDEVARCTPFLARQIELVQPKIIIAFGRFAAQTLLNTDASIGSLRGREFRYQGVRTVVSYHPAYLLRNLPDKAKAWEDLCFARELIGSGAA